MTEKFTADKAWEVFQVSFNAVFNGTTPPRVETISPQGMPILKAVSVIEQDFSSISKEMVEILNQVDDPDKLQVLCDRIRGVLVEVMTRLPTVNDLVYISRSAGSFDAMKKFGGGDEKFSPKIAGASESCEEGDGVGDEPELVEPVREYDEYGVDDVEDLEG